MISWSAFLVLLPLIFASPLGGRALSACGQFNRLTSGPYSLLTNKWGESGATSGSQCSQLEAVHDTTAVWETRYNWVGGNTIKSFTNVQLNDGINQQLGAITTMSTSWKWSQKSTGTVVADVTYDFFTSNTAGGSDLNELMVWLANFNAGPISYGYNADGKANPIASNLAIGDHTWNLYQGDNGHNTVYSFLPVSGDITSFNGDIYDFFTYLIDNAFIDTSEYLITAQAGTEVTSGEGLFSTTAYGLTIN